MKKTATKIAVLVLSFVLSTACFPSERGLGSNGSDSPRHLSSITGKSPESKMKKMLVDMINLYKDLNSPNPQYKPSQKEKIKKKSEEVFNKYKNKIDKDELNVYKHVYFFLKEATSLRGEPNNALCCYYLGSAICFYNEMVYPKGYANNNMKQVLELNYGITEDYPDKFYSTWLPKRYDMEKNQLCVSENGELTGKQPKCLKVKGCTDSSAINYNSEANTDDGSCEYPKPTPTPVVERAPQSEPKPKYQQPIEIDIPNAKMFVTPEETIVRFNDGRRPMSASDPFSMMEDLIYQDLFKNDKISLSEPVPNEPALIDFFKKYGIPLKLTIEDLQGEFLFPSGRYTINRNEDYKFWKPYAEGLASFKNSVGKICYTFGGGNFIIVVQGSADVLTIDPPMKLKEGFNDKTYTNMDITYPVNDTILIKKYVIKNNEYTNTPLPNLRGTFIGKMVGEYGVMTPRKKQIFILDGIITGRKAAEDRNAAFYIYINIEEGKKYFQENIDKIFGKEGEVMD